MTDTELFYTFLTFIALVIITGFGGLIAYVMTSRPEDDF